MSKCSVCGGTEFVEARDKDGQPYQGCARCVIQLPPQPVFSRRFPGLELRQFAESLRTGACELERLEAHRHATALAYIEELKAKLQQVLSIVAAADRVERSKGAWDDWDEQEVNRELAACATVDGRGSK